MDYKYPPKSQNKEEIEVKENGKKIMKRVGRLAKDLVIHIVCITIILAVINRI